MQVKSKPYTTRYIGKMNIKELRRIARDLGIKFKGLTRCELLHALTPVKAKQP